MTHKTIPRNSSIDRRTVLGLLSGSLAALAGCSGLSDSSDGGDGSAGPPEEQSDYIEETKIKVVRNNELALEVAVTDDIDPSSVSIITESGREFSSDYFSSGETRTSLLLTEGDDNNEPLPRGQHTLYFRGDGIETEIPLELGTTFEFEKAVPGTEHEKIRDDSLGVVVRNVGQRTGAATRTILNGENKANAPFEPIKPGETGIVEFTFLLANGSQCVKVEETTVREEELTVGFFWSDPVTVTQPIKYTDRFDSTGNGCKRTLAGEPEVVTATSVETETET